MRWDRAFAFIDLIRGEQIGRPFDMWFDRESMFHAFFRVGRRYDPYSEPPDWAALERGIGALPEWTGFRVFLRVDPPEPAGPLGGRPTARRVFEYVARTGIARDTEAVLSIVAVARRRGSGVLPYRTWERATEAVLDAADRVSQAAAALGDVLGLEPLSAPEAAAAIMRYAFGGGGGFDVPGSAVYTTAFLDGSEAPLGRLLGLGDVRARWDGTLEIQAADGTVWLARAVSAMDFGLALPGDTIYAVLAAYTGPLRVTLDVLPVRPGWETTVMKLRMNVLQALSGFGWVAGQLERDVQSSNTKKSYLKILTQGERIWSVGLRFLLLCPVDDPGDEGRRSSLARLRAQTSALVAALRRRQVAAYVERTRALTVALGAWPGGRPDVQRTRKLLSENVACLLPIHVGRPAYEGRDHDIILLTRLHLLDALDPLAGRPDNRNLIVTGASGSGKSFLLQYMLASLLEKYGDDIFVMIVEAGGSYRRFVRKYGGEVVRIGRPDGVALDPIVGVDPTSRESVMQYARMLVQMLALGGRRVGPEEEALAKMFDVVNRFLSECGHGTGVRTRDVLEWAGLTQDAETAVAMLRDYVFLDRVYVPTRRLAFIELPPALVASAGQDDPWADVIRSIVIRSIFATFFTRMTRPSVRWKILVADECWALLRARAGQGYFDYANRAFRKHGAGLWVASQSMGDFLAGGEEAFARAFVTNAFYKLLGMQVYSAPIGWTFEATAPGLDPADVWTSLGIRSAPGRYSEFLLIEGNRMRIVRLFVDPETYRLFQTDNVVLAESEAAA